MARRVCSPLMLPVALVQVRDFDKIAGAPHGDFGRLESMEIYMKLMIF